MDYSVLLHRCRRIVGVGPDHAADLNEIVRMLHHYPAGASRHVTAERLAGELAEFIEAEIKIAVPPRQH